MDCKIKLLLQIGCISLYLLLIQTCGAAHSAPVVNGQGKEPIRKSRSQSFDRQDDSRLENKRKNVNYKYKKPAQRAPVIALNVENSKNSSSEHKSIQNKSLVPNAQSNKNKIKSREKSVARLSSQKKNVHNKNQKVVSQKTQTKTTSTPVIANHLAWGWPVKGKLLHHFQLDSKAGRQSRGIDIAGPLGTPVKAASPGVVVYSGNALKSYGNLIIIKHSEKFLSAYAHNQEILVKEGESVKLGQVIAKMGKTGSENVKLHFEVRYQGKPINPLTVLPKN